MSYFERNFSIGDKIHIQLMNNYDNHQYTSQIAEIHGNNVFDAVIPIYKGRIIYIKNDALIDIVVPRGEAIYEFRAKIVNKLFGKIPLLRLEVVSEIRKIQRRNYFRLKFIQNIYVRKVINIKEKEFGERITGSMLDISGGGLCFTCTEELDDRDVVELSMNLNNIKLLLLGKIVRKSYTANPVAPYTYGVQFENITEIQRNEIMKFIFEEQRKLAKKGLI
ncbi:MAG: flagellar brake protein [Bacillota bacterium]